MNVYIGDLEKPVGKSCAIERVKKALFEHLPGRFGKIVGFIPYEDKADISILQVNGRHTTNIAKARLILKRCGKYAVIQYCVKSTMRPNTGDWLEFWRKAEVVWSYLDLFRLCDGDGVNPCFNFYHAPLGVDFDTFHNPDYLIGDREYIIATHGSHALSESVKEAVVAAKMVGEKVFHLGHELRRGEDIVCRSGIDNKELAIYYKKCSFVAGLRRTEGFEMPVLEGALAGARPIVFDQPHYRYWFDKINPIYIREGCREEVARSLYNVFIQKQKNMYSNKEHKYIRKIIYDNFSWKKIVGGFWNRILNYGDTKVYR